MELINKTFLYFCKQLHNVALDRTQIYANWFAICEVQRKIRFNNAWKMHVTVRKVKWLPRIQCIFRFTVASILIKRGGPHRYGNLFWAIRRLEAGQPPRAISTLYEPEPVENISKKDL